MKFKLKFSSEQIIVILLIVTAILWLLQNVILDRTLTISSKGVFETNVYRDNEAGGESAAAYSITDSSWIFDYELREGTQYPFCIFSIGVSKNGKGRNFTVYDELKVWVKYYGEGDGSVRLEIRGANPEYTVENDHNTLKYNEIQYSPKTEPYPLSLKWEDFSVPNWWLSQHKIPLYQHKVDVSDVMYVEFHTGEKTPLGKGQLEIMKLELKGKWLNSTIFSNIVLLFWIGTWSIYLILYFIRMRRELIIKDKQKQDLLRLNVLLFEEKNKVELKAKQDELTGLLNRYGLYDQMVNMLEKPKDGLISILFIDVDHFKMINDTKGHAEGDRILKAISTEMSRLLRREDILARWGGEEFLIVCKTSNKEGLLAFGQKLLTGIRGLPEGVTCSIGGSMGKPKDFQKLVENADQALYKAKNGGRNRMELFDECS